MTPLNSGLRPTASRLRSGSSATTSSSNTPPQHRQLSKPDSRSQSAQQSLISSSQQKSSTANNQPAIVTRSRFGFPAPTAASGSDPPATSDQKENVRQGPSESRLAKATRTSSVSATQIGRPGSALGRPASALGRPASALGRPATALGTRSANASVQPATGSQGASRIPAKTGRKRRSSSVCSQAPPSAGLQSTHDAPQANKPVGPSRAEGEVQEPCKLSRERSDQLIRTQEECQAWKARFEETQDRLNALEGAQADRVRDDQRRLEEDYCERIEQMERAFEAELRQASDQTAALEAANAQSASELDERAAAIVALQHEMSQMDSELGRSANQLMELSSAKAALESQLDASRAELARLAADNQRRVDQVTEHYHTIQAKLHMDLDQMSAEYQSLLQQSFAAGTAPTAAAVDGKPDYAREAQQLNGQVQSLQRLVESYEAEKRGWEAERKRLQEAVHDAHSQALSNERFEPHHLFHDQSLTQFHLPTSRPKQNTNTDDEEEEEEKDEHGFSDAIADEEELPLIDITLTPDVDDDDGLELKPVWGSHGRPTPDASAERIPQVDRVSPVDEPKAGRQSLGDRQTSGAEEAAEDKESLVAELNAKIAALEALVGQLQLAAASQVEAQTADADALAELRADLARVEAQAAGEREQNAETERERVGELEAVRAQLGAAAEAREAALEAAMEGIKKTLVDPDSHERVLLQLAGCEAEIERLRQELEVAQESGRGMESRYQEEVSVLQREIRDIKQDSSSTVARILEEHEQVVCQLKSESEEVLKRERGALEEQVNQAGVELENRTGELIEEIEKLKKMRTDSDGVEEGLSKRIVEIEEEVARVNLELEGARDSGRVLESSYQQELSALEQRIGVMKQESSGTVARLVEEHEEVVRQLKSQSEHDRAMDREGLETELDGARKELEARTASLNEVIEELKNRMAHQGGGHEAVLKQVAEYEEEVTRVKRELEGVRDSGMALESSYQQELSALEERIREIKQESSGTVARLVEEHEQVVRQLKSQIEHDRAMDREGLGNELDEARKELEARTASYNEVIEELKNTTVKATGHEALLKQIAEYREEVTRVKRELEGVRESGRVLEVSYQQEVSALQTQISAIRDEAAEAATRVLEDHKQTVENLEVQARGLKSDLDVLERAHKQATHKLEELAGIDLQQIEILTCRLRQERDEGRCAIRFMNLERQAIEETNRSAIVELLAKQEELECVASEERNALVVALSTLYRTLNAAERTRRIAKSVDLEGEESRGQALGPLVGTPPGAEMECTERAPISPREGSEATQSSRLASGAYAEALEQIGSLTEQVEDLKEQLLCAHVTHEEQERLGLLDLDSLRHELAVCHEQHAQHDAQQVRKISTLELSFGSIQHQFQSLEVCYQALQSDNTELNQRLVEERGKYSQSQEANEALQTEIGRLEGRLKEMADGALTYEERLRGLEGQLSIAEDGAAGSLQKQRSELSAQVGQLNLEVEQQRDLVSRLENRLEEANSCQTEHLATIGRLEEVVKSQESNRRGDMDGLQQELEDCRKTIGKLEEVQAELVAQKEAFQAQASDLASELESRAAVIVELEEAKVDLQDRCQEADRVHQQAQAELEVNLAHALRRQAETSEGRRSLVEQLEELRQTIQRLESDKQALIATLGSELEDQELSKARMVEELTSVRQELEGATVSRDAAIQEVCESKQEIIRLTHELESLGLQQSGHEELSKEYGAMVNAIEVLQGEARVLTEEVDGLRSQSDADMNRIEGFKAELVEKDEMIKSLKADLATVSKLHRNLASPGMAERMKELETQVEAKSNEAEDALDRLLDEMQKNKRLSNLVENLKIRLKSKAKPAIAEEQGERSSSDQCASPSANEPEGQLTVTSARKRKHEASFSTGETKSRVELANADKENAESTGRQARRRRISVADQKALRVESGEQTKVGAQQAGVEGALQVLSPNQTQQTVEPRRSGRNRSGSEAKPASQTNATLLANIQSLRRKQQQQGTSSQPSHARQRTHITRPSRRPSD